MVLCGTLVACSGADPTVPTSGPTLTSSVVTTPVPPTTGRLETWRAETESLAVGETWAYTMTVGCGEAILANGTWWVVAERAFTHPAYPPGWPVEVVDMGAVDGPDAYIEATITLVDPTHIEIRLLDGTLVAVYQPGDPVMCG